MKKVLETVFLNTGSLRTTFASVKRLPETERIKINPIRYRALTMIHVLQDKFLLF